MPERQSGIFIVFEGPEGGGKTTQSKLLVESLRQKKIDVIHIREPGGTLVGEKIRDVLLDPHMEIPPRSELFLFLAARSAIVELVIKPALACGTIVVGDRFDLSTRAYQVSGRKLPEEGVILANNFAKSGIEIDLTFILMTDPKVGLERKGLMSKPDRFEEAGLEFHERVFRGYKYFGDKLGGTAFTVETSKKSIEEVRVAILSELRRRFHERDF